MDAPLREWVCLNGTLMPGEEARVSVFDSGFMQGIGLFETMRGYGRRVFRLRQHIDRLINSARKLGWAVLPAADELASHVEQVVRHVNSAESRVRLTVTTGSLHVAAGDTPALTIVATASPGQRYPDECYMKGVAALVSACRQSAGDPTVGHKTTSYFARLASLRAAHESGAMEAIWLTPDEQLAEGAISNVFVVQDGVLVTPPLDTPVLPGITRATVLELANELQIPKREVPLSLAELHEADEVFITNSMMEIMPVTRVDRQPIANEKPGDVTRELAIAYGQLLDRDGGEE